MYKLLILIVPLMLNFNFAQDFELPGLGVYVGGVMGTASGDAVDDLEDLGYSLSGPMIGATYGTMVGDFPLFMGAGLGARSYAYTGGHDHDHGDDHDHGEEEDVSVCFQTFDMWATMPYPINDKMSLYGGMLFGMTLSGKETHGDEDPEDMEDDQLPGMDMGLVFGLGYTLPVMNDALALNMGYVLGLNELESDAGGSDNTWSHSGFFMTLNYNVPGM